MSKVTTALVSFVLGVITAFLALSGSHTSTSAQEPPNGGFVATNPSFAPVVRPLTGGLNKGVGIANGQQPLDGFACDDCTFTNVELSYGGGPVRLVNPKFSGKIRLNLYGAAANTAVTVAYLQAMLQNQKPPAVNPNAPIIKTATAKDFFVADLVTPYGQK